MRPHSNAISRFGLLALMLLAPALVHADATQFVGWGDQMLAQKKYDAAAKYFGAAIKADPRNAAAYHGMAFAYVGMGDQMLAQRQYAAAAKYFAIVVKADGHNAAAYRGLGYSYMGIRDINHGTQYLEFSLRLNPSDDGVRKYLDRIYQGYGNQYYQRGDKTNALAWWDKALRVDPDNTQLASYVASIRNPNAQTPGSTAVAAKGGAESVGPTPGINPWIMGGAVAILGAVMIFLF